MTWFINWKYHNNLGQFRTIYLGVFEHVWTWGIPPKLMSWWPGKLLTSGMEGYLASISASLPGSFCDRPSSERFGYGPNISKYCINTKITLDMGMTRAWHGSYNRLCRDGCLIYIKSFAGVIPTNGKRRHWHPHLSHIKYLVHGYRIYILITIMAEQSW